MKPPSLHWLPINFYLLHICTERWNKQFISMLHAKRALNILKPKRKNIIPLLPLENWIQNFQYTERNKRKWNIDCDVIAVLQNIELARWVISFVNMQFDKLMIWIYILFIRLNGAYLTSKIFHFILYWRNWLYHYFSVAMRCCCFSFLFFLFYSVQFCVFLL